MENISDSVLGTEIIGHWSESSCFSNCHFTPLCYWIEVSIKLNCLTQHLTLKSDNVFHFALLTIVDRLFSLGGHSFCMDDLSLRNCDRLVLFQFFGVLFQLSTWILLFLVYNTFTPSITK